MAMPHDIATVLIGGTKLPHAFVRNFVVVVPPLPVPGSEERIGRRLELLMGNEVNGAIGIKVMIGATGNSTQTQVGACIGLGCINRSAPHEVMPGTQSVYKCTSKTIQVGAHDFSFGGEDNEQLVDGGCPAIGLHRKRHFLLNIHFLELTAWIGSRIHPGATQNRIGRMLVLSISVLPIVVIDWCATNILEVLENQAVVCWADIGAGRFPENGVSRDSANHDAAPVVAEIVTRIGRDVLSC